MQLRHRRGTILWHHVIDSNSDLLGTSMAGWLCDLDAKTAPLVHGAQGAYCSVAAGVAKYLLVLLQLVFSWFFMRSWRSSMSFCMMFLGTYGVLGLGIFEGSSTWPERMNLDVKPRRLLNSQLFWMQWWTFWALCPGVSPWCCAWKLDLETRILSAEISQIFRPKWFNMLKFRWVEGPYAQGRTAHIFSVDFLRFSNEMLTICFLAVPAAGSSVRSHPKNVTTTSLSPEEVQHAIHVKYWSFACFTQHLIIFNHI